MIERQTAKKVLISEITKGRWVKKEGMEPSFIVSPYGEKISRARIIASVVNRFVSDDENFASITLDDSTDTIRAKTFKTAKPLDTVKIGDIVDIIGKVREFNDEIYVITEIVVKVDDPNLELLRKLEILQKIINLQKTGGESGIEDFSPKKDALRKDVMELIEKSKDGIRYEELLEKLQAEEEDVDSVVNDLLSEGICYEPTPGKIRKI